MEKKKLIAALSMLAAANAFAGTNSWTQVGADGGSIFAVQHLPGQPGVALAGGSAGLYRTENNAQSWSRVIDYDHLGFQSGIAVNPADPKVVLVASAGLYRSTDGGRTFVDSGAFSGATNPASTVAFSRDGTVAWVGTDRETIYRSTDGGQTWQLRGTGFSGSGINAIEVDATDNNVAYALTRFPGFLYRTLDGGANWSLISAGDDMSSITSAALTPNLVLGVRAFVPFQLERSAFRSADRGTTWTNSTTPTSGHYLARYSPNAAGRILAMGQGERAFTSLDDGATWTANGALPIAQAVSISLDPADNTRVLVATPLGVAASTDGGNTWSTSNTGISEGRFTLVVPALDGADRMYATGYDVNGVHVRNTTTGRWTGVGAQSSNIFGTAGYTVFALAVDPKDSTRLYMSRNGVFGVSSDGGVTWSGVGAVQANALTVDRVDGNVMYAATNSGVRKTVNGGAFWSDASAGLAPGPIAHVLIDPSHPNVLYASSNSYTPAGVYKTVDAGLSWAPASGGIENRSVARVAIDPRFATRLYAATSIGAVKSVDGGATWTTLQPDNLGGSGQVMDVAVDPASPDSVYTLWFGGTVFRSVGSSQKWEFIAAPYPNHLILPQSLALVPGHPGVLTVATDSSGLLEYTIAPDVQLTSDLKALATNASQSVVLKVQNAGPNAASAVMLTGTLPASGSGSTVQSSAGTCSVNDRQLSCSFGELMSGESANVTLAFPAVTGADPLSARVRAYESDSQPGNNEVSLPAQQRSDMQVALTSIVVGDGITYRVTATNAGPSPATSVRATLQLPSNVQFESGTGASGGCTGGSGTAVCDMGSLAPGASGTISVKVHATSAGQVTSSASVTSDGVDPIQDNNTSADGTVVAASSSSGGGGGGGGSMDLFWMGALLAVRLALRRKVA